MNAPILFALAYLAGTLAGIVSGLLLPWWASGGAAYLVGPGVFCLMFWRALKVVSTGDRPAIPATVRFVVETDTAKGVALGAFFGALAGAAAIDLAEVFPALQWPGHDIDGALLAILVGLAWAVGSVASDEEPISPFRAGLGLYLVVIVLSLLPILWGAL